MAGLCRPGGLFLFSITFDGLTVLEPEIDRDLDRRIVEQYHATMDERTGGENHRDSRCRQAPAHPASRSGYRIVEAGWIRLDRAPALGALSRR